MIVVKELIGLDPSGNLEARVDSVCSECYLGMCNRSISYEGRYIRSRRGRPLMNLPGQDSAGSSQRIS